MNWDLICYLLENFSILRTKNLRFQRADYVFLLEENAPDTDNTVYISDGSCSAPFFAHALLIRIGKGGVKGDNYILLEKGSPPQVLNALLKAQSHLRLLTEKLLTATNDQEAIDIASAYLNVPFFYFDASYRILAITQNVRFADDPEWDHMSKKGFLSPSSVRLMQESGDLDMLADKIDPFPYKASYYPFQSLVCNIRNNHRFLSRLNMLCVNDTPNELHIEECRILCSCLLHIALSSGNALSYTGPLNSMVLDLLQGRQLSEELIHDRLRMMPRLLSSLVQVCCIDPLVRNDPQVLSYYASLLNDMFESDSVITLEYDEKIILLLHAADENAFLPLYEKLSRFLDSQGLKCGLSHMFRRFNALRSYYLQALSTLSLGAQKQGINRFEDVYFDYLLSFIPRELAMAMISYDVVKLFRLQDDYLFPLDQTLKTYLLCNCNLNLTAEKLFIHKNTALYRLNHVRELIRADLEDAAQRMQLLFSFSILEKYPLITAETTE